MTSDNPILNNSYFEPKLHYAAPLDGILDYTRKIVSCCLFIPGCICIYEKTSSQGQILTGMLNFGVSGLSRLFVGV